MPIGKSSLREAIIVERIRGGYPQRIIDLIDELFPEDDESDTDGNFGFQAQLLFLNLVHQGDSLNESRTVSAWDYAEDAHIWRSYMTKEEFFDIHVTSAWLSSTIRRHETIKMRSFAVFIHPGNSMGSVNASSHIPVSDWLTCWKAKTAIL
jgi:hypothetical protein